MSKYITNDGYLDTAAIFNDEKYDFTFVVSARGIGKTYSAGKWAVTNCTEDEKYIFTRLTQDEMKLVNAENIYEEHSPGVVVKSEGKIARVYRDDLDIGYHIALSSMKDFRGINLLTTKYWIFDEFIPEPGTARRKYRGIQVLNAYETINRNRELKGYPPLKALFLSNLNDMQSEILDVFGFTDELYRLQEADPIGVATLENKKLIMVNRSGISEKKKNTALYKAAVSQEFLNMAIENKNDYSVLPIRHYSRNAYDRVGVVGGLAINRLKSEGEYYLTINDRNAPAPGKPDLFKWMNLYKMHLRGKVFASSAFASLLFEQYFV